MKPVTMKEIEAKNYEELDKFLEVLAKFAGFPPPYSIHHNCGDCFAEKKPKTTKGGTWIAVRHYDSRPTIIICACEKHLKAYTVDDDWVEL